MLSKKNRELIVTAINKRVDVDMLLIANRSSPAVNAAIITNIMKNAVFAINIGVVNNVIYFFNGKYYEKMADEEFQYIIDEVMDMRGMWSTHGFRRSIYNAIRVKLSCKDISGFDNTILCFENGVIDLKDEELKLKKHSPNFNVFFKLPYDYDPEAVCPLWKTFLQQVLPYKDVRDNLQEFLGLLFTDRKTHSVEIMMWLYGKGANGKSVVFNTIMGLLGTENTTNFDVKDLIGGADKTCNLCEVNGKLLNYCSDMDSKMLTRDAVKALISGEPCMARPKYGMPIKIENIPFMMANMNRMPRCKDDSNAWIRRIRVIPFDVTIPEDEQDKMLSRKLEKEYAGILNWILEGRKRMIKQEYKFTHSDTIEKVMDMYRRDDNTLRGFLKAYGMLNRPMEDIDEGKVIAVNVLLALYKDYCKEKRTHKDDILNPREVKIELEKLGYYRYRSNRGYQIRYYGGELIK